MNWTAFRTLGSSLVQTKPAASAALGSMTSRLSSEPLDPNALVTVSVTM